jgi:radical SAM superfamily enzyme YgiQ (UPF0313 family)
VSILEEEVQEVDLEMDCDLVGITCMTANAHRAYKLADQFRQRGCKVVLGGVHPSVVPNEAKQHCDSVVIGEAEPVWSGLLEDAERGILKPYYHAETGWDLNTYPLPRRAIGKVGSVIGIVPAIASRGCPYDCEFCCVKRIFGRGMRHVSVERVIEDIATTRPRWVMFLDDNIMGDPNYASRLFAALGKRGIRWGGQASISFVKNEGLLRQAASNGCVGLFIGLESVSRHKLELMRKGMRTLQATEEAVRRIIESGIFVHASMIFGFDEDDKGVFDDTLDFLYRTRIPSATFNILTPYPGTALHDQLKEEGRLLTTDWSYYDHCTPTFTPRLMSVKDLYEGYWRAKKSFYNLTNVCMRLPSSFRTPLLFAVSNIGLKAGLRAEKTLIDKRWLNLRAFESAHSIPTTN